MSATYQDFLRRLREERLALGMSQTEMGHLLRMSQSHYSKAELGTRRFTYYEIQCLCQTDVNTYYIFTGFKYDMADDSIFSDSTYEELICYLRIVCEIMTYAYAHDVKTLEKDIEEKLKNIQYATVPCEKGKTILYSLRKSLNHSQAAVADLLEVDIKKLRGMENGINLPNSEIMWKASEKLYIPYALFLKDRKGLAYENYHLIKLMGKTMSKDVMESLGYIHNLFI